MQATWEELEEPNLRTHVESLNDESLRTLLVEVEGILKSTPITWESICHVNSYVPLSPMQLLTMKSKVVMPPPEIFQKKIYLVIKMVTCPHLCDEVSTRWRKEVYATLQARQK